MTSVTMDIEQIERMAVFFNTDSYLVISEIFHYQYNRAQGEGNS